MLVLLCYHIMAVLRLRWEASQWLRSAPYVRFLSSVPALLTVLYFFGDETAPSPARGSHGHSITVIMR